MEGLVGWLFIILLLALASGGGGRSEEPAGPTVVVNATAPVTRSGSGLGNVVAFLAVLWLITYVFLRLT